MRFQDIRLSTHFTLLDFMHDIDLRERGTELSTADMPTEELALGSQMCRQLLEPMIEMFGPCSIAAGYCPEGTGHYQTSPHSWRTAVGAGCDVAFHDWVNLDRAPIKMLEVIAERGLPFERLITYAGSEYLCATWKSKPRYALYENVRSPDGTKPEHLQHSRHPGEWARHSKIFLDRRDWRRGPNEPVFHTRRQLRPQHVRVSRYFSFLDFCRDEHAMARGRNWCPPIQSPRQVYYARMFGEIMDQVVVRYGRVSITEGVVSSNTVREGESSDLHRWLAGEAEVKFLLPAGIEEIEMPEHEGIVAWQEDFHPSGASEITLIIREFAPQTIYSGGLPYGVYSGRVPDYLPPRVRAMLVKSRAGLTL